MTGKENPPTDDELWRQVAEAFEPHRLDTDPDWLAALNRIAAKCLASGGASVFNSSSCAIRGQVLTPSQLSSLKTYRDKTTPGRIQEPIVVLEFAGESWVIDGNKRVNKWVAEHDTQPRRAVIITSRTREFKRDPGVSITTEADLEIVFLHETHSLLADIISDEYYKTLGTPPVEVSFHSRGTLLGFLSHVEELVAEAKDTVTIEGKPLSMSLLGAAERFCERHQEEAQQSGLAESVSALRSWLNTTVDFRFRGADSILSLPLTRRKQIWYAANLGKHHLLRIGALSADLRARLAKKKVPLEGADFAMLREPFVEELESRFLYLATLLVELLGRLFLALNKVVVSRRTAAGTNDAGRIPMPEGVTSDSMRDLYGSTLVFKGYTDERIQAHTPNAPDLLKRRY